ncbi:hypothetical protein HDU92_004298 [Lobulomyces angularis]|nr:hypothetical protein HDU92_004298 [Lobulomyces angularis]
MLQFTEYTTGVAISIVLGIAAVGIYLTSQPTKALKQNKENFVTKLEREQIIKDLLAEEEKAKPIKKQKSNPNFKKHSGKAVVARAVEKSTDKYELDSHIQNTEEDDIQDLLLLSSLSKPKKKIASDNSKNSTGESKPKKNKVSAAAPITEIHGTDSSNLSKKNEEKVAEKLNQATTLIEEPPLAKEVKATQEQVSQKSHEDSSAHNPQDSPKLKVTKKLNSLSVEQSEKKKKENFVKSSEKMPTDNVKPKNLKSDLPSKEPEDVTDSQTTLIDQLESLQTSLKQELSQFKNSNKFLSDNLNHTKKQLHEALDKNRILEGKLVDFNHYVKASELYKFEKDNVTQQLSEAQLYFGTLKTENSQLKQVVSTMEEKISRERISSQNSLNDAQNTIKLYQSQTAAFDSKVNSLLNAQTDALNEADEKMRMLEEEVEKLSDEKKSLMLERKKIVEERANFQAEAYNAQKEVEICNKELLTLKDHIRTTEKNLKESNNLATKKDAEFSKKLSDNEKASNDLKLQLSNLEATKKKELLSISENTNAEILLFKTKINKLEVEKSLLQKEIESSTKGMKALTADHELLKRSLEFNQSKLSSAQQASEVVDETISSLKSQVASLLKFSNLNPVLQKARALDDIDKLMREVETFKKLMEKARDELKKSEEARIALTIQLNNLKKTATPEGNKVDRSRKRSVSPRKVQTQSGEPVYSKTYMHAIFNSWDILEVQNLALCSLSANLEGAHQELARLNCGEKQYSQQIEQKPESIENTTTKRQELEVAAAQQKLISVLGSKVNGFMQSSSETNKIVKAEYSTADQAYISNLKNDLNKLQSELKQSNAILKETEIETSKKLSLIKEQSNIIAEHKKTMEELKLHNSTKKNNNDLDKEICNLQKKLNEKEMILNNYLNCARDHSISFVSVSRALEDAHLALQNRPVKLVTEAKVAKKKEEFIDFDTEQTKLIGILGRELEDAKLALRQPSEKAEIKKKSHPLNTGSIKPDEYLKKKLDNTEKQLNEYLNNFCQQSAIICSLSRELEDNNLSGCNRNVMDVDNNKVIQNLKSEVESLNKKIKELSTDSSKLKKLQGELQDYHNINQESSILFFNLNSNLEDSILKLNENKKCNGDRLLVNGGISDKKIHEVEEEIKSLKSKLQAGVNEIETLKREKNLIEADKLKLKDLYMNSLTKKDSSSPPVSPKRIPATNGENVNVPGTNGNVSPTVGTTNGVKSKKSKRSD